ncbi:hypothetical protein A4U94_01335 [Prescottella equi]|uniref:hypothetical protein n=1 Tax=Rhodococcus hoagii TaxID=43767 RepID=UPI0009BFBEBE|nr:hypothetical protein [Prescottella equi]OQQ28715.1 hypothetical protein A4U94_01335 [Prescottella equi]
MKRSDISDSDVVRACRDARAAGGSSLGLLIERTNAPRKVALAAMDRALDRDLIDYGVSIAYAWPNGDVASRQLRDGPPQLAGRDFAVGGRIPDITYTFAGTWNDCVLFFDQPIPKSRLIERDPDGQLRCRICGYTQQWP